MSADNRESTASLSKSSSTRQASARRSPITSRLGGQAADGIRSIKLARVDEMTEPRVGARSSRLSDCEKTKVDHSGRRTMPRKLCPQCHGQRTISCPACHGTGKKTIANTSLSDCEECGRTGRRPCDVCGGTGEVEHLSVALNGS